jgi:hypothetical protein
MPRYDSTRLASYFDAEVSRAPSMRAYNQENMWIPRNKKPEQKPDNKRFHRRGDEWVPEDWGYLSPEQLEARKKKRALASKKTKRTEEEKIAHRQKMKKMSEAVAKHHKDAMNIVMETHAFSNGPAYAALKYIVETLDETLKGKRRERVRELRAQFPGKGQGKNIDIELAKTMTPSVDLAELNKNVSILKTYFHEGTVFEDHYHITRLPDMQYLSTAISYFSMVKHQIMKAIAHKVRAMNLPSSPKAQKFLEHNDAANDLLKDMKRGWHTGMVKKYRVDAIEHNKFQRRLMTSKFHEWKESHTGATKIPSYVRKFDPDRLSPPQAG